jgi:hypothetical protein
MSDVNLYGEPKRKPIWKEHDVDTPDPQAIGDEAEFVDNAIDDDEVSVKEQLALDRKEFHELGLTLDNPEGFADDL